MTIANTGRSIKNLAMRISFTAAWYGSGFTMAPGRTF